MHVLIVALTMLLMNTTAAAQSMHSSNYDIHGEINLSPDQAEDEEGLVTKQEAFELSLPTHANWRSQGSRGRIPVNVDSFGAAGDGTTDDTQVHIQYVFLNSAFVISQYMGRH